MLESKASQFTFSPEGQILWQEKLNSPLPGVAVASLSKGKSALRPVINIIECEQTLKYDKTALINSLNIWMNTYLSEVLEPLILLEVPKGVEPKEDLVSQIAAKIYEGMGIVMRADIEDLISGLTVEMRADLRAKHIRLGPVLAFIPALNKPAAVRLKAMLWSIFYGAELPADVPADGIVSFRVEGELEGKKLDERYYRAIGYPLYGGRAVRIDMLDRVINSVYENAKSGKFQARHEMAEWLGCSIEDLYKILEAMGHKKIYDPAENISEEEQKPAEHSKELKDKRKDKQDDVKPELATFRLKKGKASGKKDSGKKENKKEGKKSNFKKKKMHKHSDKHKKTSNPRVMSAKAKVSDDDSPFAILQQLKK